tara:strand:- start:1745 stop:2509 length:765 start_codon:yes stop_codon:yes gene_type:complete
MLFSNIEEFLNITKKDTIIFCVANIGILDMLENFIISCLKNNIDIVLFALDSDVASIINNKYNIDIIQYGDEFSSILKNKFNVTINLNNFIQYNTANFKYVCAARLFIINYILKKNKCIIHLDVDIVIKKNFYDEIKDILKTNECVYQFNGVNCCCGFFAMKPTQKIINFLEVDNLKKLNIFNYVHDQDFWNKVAYDNKLFNIKLLNRDHYPNGGHYYNNHKNIKDVCRLIHFNCLIGETNKINKMKELNEWFF